MAELIYGSSGDCRLEKYCLCGCGIIVKNKFASGHNTKLLTKEEQAKRLGVHSQKGKKPWNKDLTKELDVRIARRSEKVHQKFSSGLLKIWNKGITKDTDERVQNISLKLLGFKHSDKSKLKMSSSRKKLYASGYLHPNLGKTYEELHGINKANKLKQLHSVIFSKLCGDKHYNWKGGISKEPYGIQWNNRLRKYIKNRDENCCWWCGKNSSLIVHHKDTNKKNNDECNLVTLCRPCHCKFHHLQPINLRFDIFNRFNSFKQEHIYGNKLF